jgi:integrase
MRRRRLNDKQVAALRVRATRYTMPDPELVGHYVRVMPSGVKSFVAVARDPTGKQIWVTIGATDHIKIEEARDKAREVVRRIKASLPPLEVPPPAPDSFATVADNWIKRHVAAKGLRTRGEIERCLSRYVLPHWRDRPFAEIKRRDVALLLDHVEDNSGPRQADAVLTIIRSLANWYSTRDDTYQSPIVKGMKRCTNGARERILNDDELRQIWEAAEQGGQFGSLVQLALLTGQRLDKLIELRWADISSDGVWNVPAEDREKGTGGELVLPEMALSILRRQPRIFGTDLVFPPARGNGRMSASQGKKTFEASLPPMERWTIHDLRRTARSLMSRAGVTPEHAERVLGHVIGGVAGIYDRHSYRDEKRIALAKLATLIATIVSGKSATVTPMRSRRP